MIDGVRVIITHRPRSICQLHVVLSLSLSIYFHKILAFVLLKLSVRTLSIMTVCLLCYSASEINSLGGFTQHLHTYTRFAYL